MSNSADDPARGIQESISPRHPYVPALAVLIIAAAYYFSTAFPSITWWDSAEYSTAAWCFGVPHPPGSLLLVLLGWPATLLAFGPSPAYILNLLAGLLAALTAAGVCLLVQRLDAQDAEPSDTGSSIAVAAALALAGLIFALSQTLWQYGTMFTPYVLTALFTVIIVAAMLRWWRVADRREALRWLIAIAFLFGLDFSVHRTNLLLLPGLLVWILLRRPRLLTSLKTWLAGVISLGVGLSAQLLLIPMAMRDPAMNQTDPSNFARWWDYITVKQYGGSFLINLWPRHGRFFADQVMNYLRAFADNFLPIGHGFGIFGVVPLLLGLIGIVLLWRRRRRLCIGLLVLYLCSSLGAVIYFNVPADFFRSMARHYLPSFVLFAIFMLYAAVAIVRHLLSREGRVFQLATLLVLTVLAATATYQPVRNYHRVDGSGNYFTADYATNALNGLPPHAIVVTAGDNDTYPLWYMRDVEGVRRDVVPINLFLLNTPWFVDQILRRHPDFPLPLTRADRGRLYMIPWRDTTICLPIAGTDLPGGIAKPDSLCLDIQPTVADKYLMVQDRMLLEILSNTLGKRPLYVMSTVSQRAVPWLAPYLQTEGVANRVVPVESPPADVQRLHTNLMEVYSYRNCDNPAVRMGRWDHSMLNNYYPLWLSLIAATQASGDTAAAAADLDALLRLLPVDRLDPPAPYRQGIERLKSSVPQ